ncbi:MAG: hypothetical protein FWD41_01510 [Actinomycetia bacterium]|nr:hypothetical protein [Actinomycetes bacterium]
MCQSGVNTAQLTTMVKMADDSIGLTRNWVHEIEHLAGHVDLKSTPALSDAYRKLGEAKRLLAQAADELESGVEAPGFEVELV